MIIHVLKFNNAIIDLIRLGRNAKAFYRRLTDIGAFEIGISALNALVPTNKVFVVKLTFNECSEADCLMKKG